MKRLIFVTLSALLLFCNAEAQLEMNSTGNVGIGITPSSSYKLYVKGTTRIGNYSGQRIDITSDKIKFMAGYYGHWYFSASGEEQRLLPYTTNSGYLGLSNKQLYKIYGRYIYANGVLLSSDERMKTNLRQIENPLERLQQIQGVKYDHILPSTDSLTENKKLEMQSLDKDNIGFLAQELQEIFPELVKYNQKEDDYRVDYIGMIPVLVEAIKEQQSEIEELKKNIELLGSGGELKSSSSITTSSSDFDIGLDKTSLFQNSPNPFTEETKIKYYLEDNVTAATIFIYDMSGKQLRSYELHHRSEGNITINGGELDAGMYMYTLITDGKLVCTKQMLLTD